jgi:pyroglutamyl-peptidase
MSTVLVTGFGPFGEVRHNPSQAAIARLPTHVRGRRVVTAILPVDSQAVPAVLAGLALLGPSLVVHTGVAVDRRALSLERVAENRLEFGQPDNAGRLVRGERIFEGAPARLKSRLPEAQILEAWRRAEIPCEGSDSAGTYLCNQTFYTSLFSLPESVPVGFVHLPPDETLGEALGVPSLPLAVQARGLLLLLESLLPPPARA